MQTITIMNGQSMAAPITGTGVIYDALMDSVGVAVVEMKQSSATAPSGTCNIQIQGSLDGSDWAVLYSVGSGSLTTPIGVSPVYGSGNGGYRTVAQVVQTMPLMRVCTDAGVSNTTLTVIIANGQ